MLFDINCVELYGPYNSVFMEYNQEQVDRINIYATYKSKNKLRYRVNRVSLTKIERDKKGRPVKSKRKLVNAFVANLIHYLDSFVCHQLVDTMAREQKPIGTIHDCFYIKCKDSHFVNKHYKYGLAKVMYIFEYNFCRWMHNILVPISNNDSSLKHMLHHCAVYQTLLEELIFNNNFSDIEHMKPMEAITSSSFQNNLRMWVNKIENTKTKEKWGAILQFMRNCPKPTDFAEIQESLLNESDDFCLFPDNE